MEPAQRTEARTSRVTAPRTCSPIDNRVLDYLGEVHRQAIPSVDLSDFFVGGFHPFSLGCGHHLPPAKPVRMLASIFHQDPDETDMSLQVFTLTCGDATALRPMAPPGASPNGCKPSPVSAQVSGHLGRPS